MIVGVLGKIGLKLLTSFLTEKVLAKLMFALLKRFAKMTANKIDDELVADVEKAYYLE